MPLAHSGMEKRRFDSCDMRQSIPATVGRVMVAYVIFENGHSQSIPTLSHPCTLNPLLLGASMTLLNLPDRPEPLYGTTVPSLFLLTLLECFLSFFRATMTGTELLVTR